MDRNQLRRELSFLEVRIADTQEHISHYRDRIDALKNSDRKAEFEATMLEACEILLCLQVGIQEKLKQQLATSQKTG